LGPREYNRGYKGNFCLGKKENHDQPDGREFWAERKKKEIKLFSLVGSGMEKKIRKTTWAVWQISAKKWAAWLLIRRTTLSEKTQKDYEKI